MSLERQLQLHINHLRQERNDEDILFEILLKSGFQLTVPVESLTLAGKRVYLTAGRQMMVCLEQGLSLEFLRAMADFKPERVVLLDSGFEGHDDLKENAVQIFKAKGVTSFKTV